jgi:ParB-like chromosome segregation protein Spo0J
MTTLRTFSNEDLTAYLDGEADASLVRAIDEAKVTSADLCARLGSLRIDAAGLSAAFDAVLPLAPALPETIAHVPARLAKPWPWRAMAATALISLAIGWGVSSLAMRTQTETWQHYAATYHAMYVHDTLAHVRPTAQTTAEELRRVSETLGLAIKPEVLARSELLEFKRAQVLGFEGRPVVQLAFVSRTGAPVALCITRTDSARTDTFRPSTILGMSASTWSKGRYEYLLIGGTDATMIATSAATFEKAL